MSDNRDDLRTFGRALYHAADPHASSNSAANLEGIDNTGAGRSQTTNTANTHTIPNSAAKPCATCDGSGVCYEPAQHDGATGYEFPCPECNATRNRACDHQWRHAGHIGPGTERSVCLLCGIVLVET